jgi:hypothetical protein
MSVREKPVLRKNTTFENEGKLNEKKEVKTYLGNRRRWAAH